MTYQRKPYLVRKAFNGFLLASVLTAGATQANALIDGLMVSVFINENAMSAVNVSSPATQIMFSLSMLLGVGGSILAGVAIGKHDRQEASKIFSLVTTAIVALGLIIAVAGNIFITPLTAMLCPDPAIQPYAHQFLQVMLTAAPLSMLMTVMQTFVTLDGEPRRVTLAVMVSLLINAVLDYVFIKWCGWGIAGSAWATVICFISSICILGAHFKGEGTLKFALPGSLIGLKSVLGMGLPFGLATTLIAVQLYGSNIIAIRFLGTPGIVALSVCLYMLLLSMIILTGTLESFQPVASILKGSNDNRGVLLVLRHAYRFLVISLSAFALVLVCFPGWIITLFSIDSPEAAATLREALPAYAVNIVLQCVIYLLIPVYQIYNNKKFAYVISVGQPLMPMIVFGLMTYAAVNGMGGVNPWWGFAIGQLTVVVLLALVTLRRKGNYIPFILIPKVSADTLLDATISPDEKALHSLLADVRDWLSDNNIDETLSLRVQIAIEETVNNIMRHALEQKRDKSMIDVRLSLDSSTLTAVVRDEGKPFNPIEQDPQMGIGLLLVRNVCDSQKYEHLFHQNLLTVAWNR